jgi:hypothetical protein
MYYENLKEAYKIIYDGIRQNCLTLSKNIPCYYTIEVLTNLNIMLFDYTDSQHSYLRARLIANQDWQNAIMGIPYQDRF